MPMPIIMFDADPLPDQGDSRTLKQISNAPIFNLTLYG